MHLIHAKHPARLARWSLRAGSGFLVGVVCCVQIGWAEEPTASAGGSAAIKFELDVQPILTAAGCNAGACHGKARGQNGFQLSLLGFDPDFDYAAIVMHDRGRRVFPSAPEESLLLRKASASIPHGGGVRLPKGGDDYRVIQQWIALGFARSTADDPVLQRIELSPSERFLQTGERQKLTVVAHYSDGSTRDVTARTAFQSSESAIASVDRGGLVTAGTIPGEAAIMARYMGQINAWNVVIPLAGDVDGELYRALPRYNFIDGLVWDKLQALGVTPSESASDATFLRRVYLDLIGRLPSPQEARDFSRASAASAPSSESGTGLAAHRVKLIDDLLARPEYADHWANKWADLLRPNPYRVGIKATLNFDAWIREAFRKNLPHDQFVRQLLTAQGSTWRNGAVTMFRDRRTPEELTTMVSQLFLGVRLECARCHHHPFEVWGQDDFFSLAAYFGQIGFKGESLSPPISGGEEMLFSTSSGQVTHPLTGKVLAPRPLVGTAPEIAPQGDPRLALAEWVTADDNPFFAQAAANRIWAEVMGRGLVEPVDDLRATNPPSNGPLLAALAREFQQSGYDSKALLRTIVSSYVYGLSSLPNARNSGDTRNYSRHYRQRLRAEVLMGALCDVTGVEDRFRGMPPGTRANALWTFRTESSLLDAFGRPDANQDPPCERTTDTSLVQALHLMNAPALNEKIASDQGTIAKLVASDAVPQAIVEELYLATYARLPTADELNTVLPWFADPRGTRRAAEDLLWALINTPEFLFED